MTKGHKIRSVEEGSIAWKEGVESGMYLVSVNGTAPEDVFDYRFLMNDDHVEILIREENGDETLLEIDKEPFEDFGVEFESSLMDDYRSCCNRCIFCFIDQMPPGMRETLYFKDDDTRLSFLQGNYVTLTNLSDRDIGRIIRYRMEPINISVHTMDPELRCRMLHNRFAGEALKKIDTLFEAGITMNGQIVCCPGWNDGEQLRSTIEKLARYAPVMQSVSVVPVGLTKYRDGLEPLRPFTAKEAGETIDIIEAWQKKLYPQHGLHFVHASDEFYLLAGREIPEKERYDGYLQLENGVGMLRLFSDQFDQALKRFKTCSRKKSATIVTGMLAYPVAALLMNREAALFTYVIPFLVSTAGGTLIAAALIAVLARTHALSHMRDLLAE